MLVPAPLALEPGEAAGEEAAPQKPFELLLYEAGQPGAVTHTRRAQSERLQMVADDLIQDALRRRSRPTSARTFPFSWPGCICDGSRAALKRN
jgi:hypothetical protein